MQFETDIKEAPGTYVVIDVRSKSEFEGGHVEGALHIPVGRIANEIEAAVPDKSKPIKLYCLVGGRAEQAKVFIEEKGYTNVKNLGGYEDALKALHLK